MAKFLYKLGTFIAKHKWWSVLVWIVLLAAIVTPLANHTPEFDNDIEMNGLKSLDTNDKIGEEFNQDSEKASVRIVFRSNSDNGITKKGTKKDIRETLNDIKNNDDYVESVTDPYDAGQINDDETTAFADINYVVSQTGLKDESITNINNKLDDLKDDHLIQTELSGMEDLDFGGTSEIIGIVVAFIVLLVTFGSLIAAGMPILSAVLGLGTSVGIIALLTYTFNIPNVTLTLAVMIGLAVGIDYALFILFRYKQIIKTETNHIKALGLAVGTAGSAVIFAGITVIIAVCGLALVGIDFLAVMGFASAISVFLAVLSALTLLPALISIFHKRIHSKQSKSTGTANVETTWSKFVVGKPAVAVILGLVILALAIIPMSHMRLGMPDDGMKPNDTTQKRAYDIISDDFGEGYNGQIVMLVNTKDKGDKKAIEQDLNNLTDDIEDMDNVDTVAPAQLNQTNDYALVSIIPEEGPNAKSTNDLVYDLRDYNEEAQDQYNFDTEVSGQSVINIDMSKKLNDAIPVFAGVIVALAFILLMVVFRSILIPLKAVLGFVLSLAATLGFTTLIMQDGFMSELFGVDTTGPLLAFLPVIVIGLLFGLAMDYEVFLMSRIHEEYSKTKDNDYSIKVGIKESGPVIVAAALIMFSVFIAFVFQDDVMIKSMGLSLAFGVLFDAFIVRMMLIPALTRLFGQASWYVPKWLDRLLPKIDIEGHALQDDMPQEQAVAAGYNQSVGRGTGHFSRLADIEIDNRTQHLYRDLLNGSSDNTGLFNAILFNSLMQYAKDHQRDVYDKYIANTAENNIYDQANVDTDDLAQKRLHDQQQKNSDVSEAGYSQEAKDFERPEEPEEHGNSQETDEYGKVESTDKPENTRKIKNDEELKESDIKELLKQQNQNTEKMNEILSKLLDKDKD